jgi:hypothetical protein
VTPLRPLVSLHSGLRLAFGLLPGGQSPDPPGQVQGPSYVHWLRRDMECIRSPSGAMPGGSRGGHPPGKLELLPIVNVSSLRELYCNPSPSFELPRQSNSCSSSSIGHEKVHIKPDVINMVSHADSTPHTIYHKLFSYEGPSKASSSGGSGGLGPQEGGHTKASIHWWAYDIRRPEGSETRGVWGVSPQESTISILASEASVPQTTYLGYHSIFQP